MSARVLITLALAILAAAPVAAQNDAGRDRGLLLAGASYHAGGIRAKNELHPAIGVQTARWSAGVFENSDGRPSAWAARRWTSGRAFAELGLATNYDVSPVLPLVRAGVSFRHAEVFVMPAYGTRSKHVGVAIVVQLRVDSPRWIAKAITGKER